MRTLILGAILALACTTTASAHDFWLQPQGFRTPVGTATPFTLQVGHGPERQRSKLPARRIVRLTGIAPDGGRTDLRAGLTLGGDTDGSVRFVEPGAHLVVLETDYGGRSVISPARFQAYVAEEGLEAVAVSSGTARERAERYARNAKMLVITGDGEAGAALKPVGLALEIVPEALPRAGASLPVRVIYQGRPLAGALVKLTDLDHDARPLVEQRTDPDGRARFALPAKGGFLLNVVWTRPLKDEDVDFETVFSSLTFGVP